MTRWPWDNGPWFKTNKATNSKKCGMSTANDLLFFTAILSDCDSFHVPLIQMANIIIGAPNLMQAFCCCYLTRVDVGVSLHESIGTTHPLINGKAMRSVLVLAAVLGVRGIWSKSTAATNKRILFIPTEHNKFNPPPKHKSAH